MYAFQLVTQFQPYTGQLPNESGLCAQTKTVDNTIITPSASLAGWFVLAEATNFSQIQSLLKATSNFLFDNRSRITTAHHRHFYLGAIMVSWIIS